MYYGSKPLGVDGPGCAVERMAKSGWNRSVLETHACIWSRVLMLVQLDLVLDGNVVDVEDWGSLRISRCFVQI